MNDDELRARLQAADPARRDAPADSWIDELVEATMDEQGTGPDIGRDIGRARPGRSRWLAAGAAAAVAVIAVGGYAIFAGANDDGSGNRREEARTELALTLPKGDPMQMCIQFSVDILRPMETAFAGTATDVAGDQVTLDVDRWYKGGDADVVKLTGSTDAGVMLEGGIRFTEGERYLVTATDGSVNGCGFSSVWSQEMADAFEAAFGG
jgi:hypothetical protein